MAPPLRAAALAGCACSFASGAGAASVYNCSVDKATQKCGGTCSFGTCGQSPDPAAGCACNFAAPSWAEWKRAHGRSYSTPAEDAARAAVYASNARAAAALSAADPEAQYGPGPFSDLTPAEFADARLRAAPAERAPAASAPTCDWVNGQCYGRCSAWLECVPDPDPAHDKTNCTCDLRNAAPPAGKVDWRKAGAVTPVADQGALGSVAAYSVADAVAAQWFISGHTPLVALSYKQLADCAGLGPSGLGTSKALAYANKDGLETGSYYSAHPSCTLAGPVVRTKSSVSLAQGEGAILQWLNSTGPVIVGVDATSWQQYMGGVISSKSKSINHLALLVGYGSGYWVVKNSWGSSWGEQGYARIAYGSDACGIAELATGVTV